MGLCFADIMATGRARYMTLKPSIDTTLVKRVHTIIENSHGLTLFDGILTDCTIIGMGMINGDEHRIFVNMCLSRSDGNGLIKEGLNIHTGSSNSDNGRTSNQFAEKGHDRIRTGKG